MKIFFFFLFSTALFAQLNTYSDMDMDGVSDSRDRCPGTSFDDIVTADGCPEKKLFFLAAGVSGDSGDYGSDSTISSRSGNMQFGYAKENLSASLSTSYQSSGAKDSITGDLNITSGMSDTYLAASYTYFLDKDGRLGLSYLANIKFPTADEDIGTGNMDLGAFVMLTFTEKAWTYSVLAGRTATGDDSQTIYNDINSYSLGIGNTLNDSLYLSATASYSDPLLEGSDPSEILSIYCCYNIDRLWDASLSYSHGFTDATADESLSAIVSMRF